jgi:hypothetical protein
MIVKLHGNNLPKGDIIAGQKHRLESFLPEKPIDAE